jgi:DMSO reductase anchor subunit
MHPAYSVIIFTVASGAGYGLLVWLSVAAILDIGTDNPRFGLTAFFVAFALITLGLLSSTLHLGRPKRAWRAFSQWRTSWLSREGVLAVATFLPAGLLALLWVFADGGPWLVRTLLAAGSIALALATVWCTGMIYQSLPTIRAWHQPMVSPVYVGLALASGATLFHGLGLLPGYAATWTGIVASALLLEMARNKLTYWRTIDTLEKPLTPGDATGLKALGTVRVLEPPHTQANFVMREMGFVVARKHALILRRLVLIIGFAVPTALLLLSMLTSGMIALAAGWLAIAAMAFGLIVERWLFFAEAQHVVTLYYGADRA